MKPIPQETWSNDVGWIKPEWFGDPTKLNGKPFDSSAEYTVEYGDDGEVVARHWSGPVYPRLPELDHFRRLAKSGCETDEDKRAYGAAVQRAFKKLNKVNHRPYTVPKAPTYNRAEALARVRAASETLAREQYRRIPDKMLWEKYHEAMKEKRAAEAKPKKRPMIVVIRRPRRAES